MRGTRRTARPGLPAAWEAGHRRSCASGGEGRCSSSSRWLASHYLTQASSKGSELQHRRGALLLNACAHHTVAASVHAILILGLSPTCAGQLQLINQMLEVALPPSLPVAHGLDDRRFSSRPSRRRRALSFCFPGRSATLGSTSSCWGLF